MSKTATITEESYKCFSPDEFRNGEHVKSRVYVRGDAISVQFHGFCYNLYPDGTYDLEDTTGG